MNMYSVYDQKAEAYGQPIFLRTHGEAMRTLEDELARGDSLIAQHPEDFILFFVGHFDELSGVFTVEDTPLVLGRASSMVRRQDDLTVDP